MGEGHDGERHDVDVCRRNILDKSASLIPFNLQTYLFQQIRRQHQHLGIWPETLNSTQVAYTFLQILGRRHDFKDVKRSPRHIMTKHLEIDELQERRRLEI